MKGLTDKQQEILDYIGAFQDQEGMAPTIDEIARHFAVTASTSFSHIRSLQKKGYLNRSSKARSLALVDQEHCRRFSLSISIPVLGRISAGAPLLSEEHIERHLNLDPSLLPRKVKGEELFALQVQGESMRDLGILNGDLVIARQGSKVSQGDIVIALVEGETTVKSLYLSSGQWELRPANPDYRPIRVPLEELSVQGVVVALHRTY